MQEDQNSKIDIMIVVGDLQVETSHKELSRTLPQYQGNQLRHAQGPCKYLQSETVRQSWDMLAHRRTNSTLESRRATAAVTLFPEDFSRANFNGFVSSEAREVQVLAGEM